MAIQLYEKFICCIFRQFYDTGLMKGTLRELWFQSSMRILKEKKLHLMSCFQLIYKMQSTALSITQVNMF
jgi:hypothetical protein